MALVLFKTLQNRPAVHLLGCDWPALEKLMERTIMQEICKVKDLVYMIIGTPQDNFPHNFKFLSVSSVELKIPIPWKILKFLLVSD